MTSLRKNYNYNFKQKECDEDFIARFPSFFLMF